MPSVTKSKSSNEATSINARRKSMPLLAAISLLSLSACGKAETAKLYCPVPVYPSDCAISWFMETETPECVVDWLDRADRQQQAIEENCK